MKLLRNPFVILAFGLTFLFFVPTPEDYLGIKIVIALMVISYGISLGAFKGKNLQKRIENNSLKIHDRLQEVEKKLAELENKGKFNND